MSTQKRQGLCYKLVCCPFLFWGLPAGRSGADAVDAFDCSILSTVYCLFTALATRLILVPKFLILAVRQVRKLHVPRMFHRSSITSLILPAVVQQQKYGGTDRY